MTLEDESVCGYTEAIAWKDSSKQIPDDEVTIFQNRKSNPCWYSRMNGNMLKITVKFDHDCLARNPNHTVCVPQLEHVVL
jgi:hypothetical protein